MLAVVLADTHLGDDGLDRLSPSVLEMLAGAAVILHAGDVVSPAALDGFRALADGSGAQFHAVLGNNDGALAGMLPETVLVELDGVRVGMVHDGGRREGRPARLRRRFPTADLVVFGHSHVPCDEIGVGGQRLFNPGSPTQRRAQPERTVGLLELDRGQVRRHLIRSV